MSIYVGVIGIGSNGIPDNIVALMEQNVYVISDTSVVDKRKGNATGVWINPNYMNIIS